MSAMIVLLLINVVYLVEVSLFGCNLRSTVWHCLWDALGRVLKCS